jgi:hypothetical protein
MKGTIFLCTCIIGTVLCKINGIEEVEEQTQGIANMCYILWACDFVGWMWEK